MTNDECGGEAAAAEWVVAWLVADWWRVFRLTTIDQALAALGIAPSWAVRRAVADRLSTEPGLSPVLRRWGVATFALSNDERLLGRELARVDQALTLAELAARAGLTMPVARERLRMLAYLGIVALAGDRVALAPDHAARLGPLGWLYQAVQLDHEPPFNVPCPVDFLLLAHGSYRERHLTMRRSASRRWMGRSRRLSQGVRWSSGVVVEVTICSSGRRRISSPGRTPTPHARSRAARRAKPTGSPPSRR